MNSHDIGTQIYLKDSGLELSDFEMYEPSITEVVEWCRKIPSSEWDNVEDVYAELERGRRAMKMKRIDWIQAYQATFEPGSAPSESTVLRRLRAGKIPGVEQFQIGGEGQWYVRDRDPTPNPLANKIIEQFTNDAA